MTAAQMIQAAEAAIRAMSPEARDAFVSMMEGGQHDTAATVAKAYAVEGVSRQIRMASMAMESSRVMSDLTEAVYEAIAR